MKSLWSKFLAMVHTGTSSFKREELQLLGELVKRVEGIESHLTDNDDDTVDKYNPSLDSHVSEVNEALRNVTAAEVNEALRNVTAAQ